MKKITMLLLAIAAVATGCKKFTDINQNQNQPTTVTANVVLSAALTGSASDLANDFISTTRWMGYWARSGNFIQTIPTETYALTSSYADGDFQSLYTVLTRYDYIEHNNGGDPFYVGVAKTMKALHFSTLVDAFGNVPYTQAFNLTTNPTPKYDDAATIYANLITQCDSAVYYFDKAVSYYTTAQATQKTADDKYDIMFGRGTGGTDTVAADVRLQKWIQFTNTVKLKLLMTVRQAGGTFTTAYINSEIAKSTENGAGYIGAGESAAVNPGYTNNSAAQQNPFYANFILTSGSTNNDYAFYRANAYWVNFGNNTGDFRFADVFKQNQSSSPYVTGNYDGDPAALSNTYTSGFVTSGTGLLQSATMDELILSDFESLFIQAEAVQEGFLSGDAAQLAKEGTEQGYIYVNDDQYGEAPSAAADDFLAGDAGDPKVDVTVGGLQAIMTLKWSALSGVNWEQAYTDYRRTGYPVPDGNNFGFSHANNLVKHSSPDITGAAQPVNLPYRYLYPQSEINTNGKNVPQGITAYTPIFWDTREK